jgi:hypothetical protein
VLLKTGTGVDEDGGHVFDGHQSKSNFTCKNTESQILTDVLMGR